MHLRSYPSGGKTLQSGKEPSSNENDESKKKIGTNIFKMGNLNFETDFLLQLSTV